MIGCEVQVGWWLAKRVMLRNAVVAVVFVGVISAPACGNKDQETEAESTESASDKDVMAAAAKGAKPPAKMRTIASTPELVAKGKAKFATCSACHGAEGEGKVGQGPALNSDTFLAAASDEFLFNTIKHGRAGTTMVPWGGSMSDEDIEGIVAYIRSMNGVDAAELNESELKGDPTAGQKIYADICSACHGRTGAGYQETANGTGIGRAAFLGSVTNGFMRHLVKHGKSQTKMRPFDEKAPTAVANLDDQQIEDVIAYLRKNAW